MGLIDLEWQTHAAGAAASSRCDAPESEASLTPGALRRAGNSKSLLQGESSVRDFGCSCRSARGGDDEHGDADGGTPSPLSLGGGGRLSSRERAAKAARRGAAPAWSARTSQLRWSSPGSEFRMRWELFSATVLPYQLLTLPLRLCVMPGLWVPTQVRPRRDLATPPTSPRLDLASISSNLAPRRGRVPPESRQASELLGWLAPDLAADAVYVVDIALHLAKFTAHDADDELISDRRTLRRLWLREGGGRLDLLASLPLDYLLLAAIAALQQPYAQLALLARLLRLLRLARLPRHVAALNQLLRKQQRQLSAAMLRLLVLFTATCARTDPRTRTADAPRHAPSVCCASSSPASAPHLTRPPCAASSWCTGSRCCGWPSASRRRTPAGSAPTRTTLALTRSAATAPPRRPRGRPARFTLCSSR